MCGQAPAQSAAAPPRLLAGALPAARGPSSRHAPNLPHRGCVDVILIQQLAAPEIGATFIHTFLDWARMTSENMEVVLKPDVLFASVIFATLASVAAVMALALVRRKADKNRMAVAEKLATAALIGTAALAALLRQPGLW